jgi:hypothetical protein
MFSLQSAELLPKRQIFQDQVAARAKTTREENDHEPQQAEH